MSAHRERAEELAGLHSKECYEYNDPPNTCCCDYPSRVAGILKLMEDCESAKVDASRLLARHEAAEAKVRELEELNDRKE